MAERYFEAFTLLEATHEPDGLGGQRLVLTPGAAFSGAITHTAGQEAKSGGRTALHLEAALLHEYDLTLVPGDHVRRERDGAVFRVTGRSDGMRTPAFSGLRYAQVPVERWDEAC